MAVPLTNLVKPERSKAHLVSSNQKCYLYLVNISRPKSKEIDCLPPETIKESCNLTGEEHILVYKLKLRVLN